MKGFWRRLVSTLLVVGGAWITLLACAHDDSTLFVYNVLAGNISGTSCTFTPNPSNQFLPRGVLDVGLAGAYDATFLVGNQLVSQANPSTPQTESAFITIDHVNVKVTQTNGALINQYSTVTSSTVPPATGTTPGFAVVDALILDRVRSPRSWGLPLRSTASRRSCSSSGRRPAELRSSRTRSSMRSTFARAAWSTSR
jgi:hypothetical protein